ncbi:MAG: hypothetical protein GXP16_14100 [Gammaproteobacteria bacterium]|nr:hypothetical protein [Gammaproteobacteria bacterium]
MSTLPESERRTGPKDRRSPKQERRNDDRVAEDLEPRRNSHGKDRRDEKRQ